jgi:hypothetical protein
VGKADLTLNLKLRQPKLPLGGLEVGCIKRTDDALGVVPPSASFLRHSGEIEIARIRSRNDEVLVRASGQHVLWQVVY